MFAHEPNGPDRSQIHGYRCPLRMPVSDDRLDFGSELGRDDAQRPGDHRHPSGLARPLHRRFGSDRPWRHVFLPRRQAAAFGGRERGASRRCRRARRSPQPKRSPNQGFHQHSQPALLGNRRGPRFHLCVGRYRTNIHEHHRRCRREEALGASGRRSIGGGLEGAQGRYSRPAPDQ